MNVVIRTDSSIEIGTGHVVRCLTLAKQLKNRGANITFICRDFLGNCVFNIKNEGFDVHMLPFHESMDHCTWIKENWKQDNEETKQIIKNTNKEIGLLIVDHYGLDIKWESNMRSVVNHIMVIDDLADRPHDCDLILDQNYYSDKDSRYNGLVSNACIQLLGPNYVLLRDEFLSIDPQKTNHNGKIKNILVFFGGTDPTGETAKVLQIIHQLELYNIEFNIVVGNGNPQKNMIEKLCRLSSNTKFHCQVSNMAELMLNADISIGAGGTTAWERCYMGLPSIIIIVADNQKEVAKAVANQGAAYCVGVSEEITGTTISSKIKELCNNPQQVKVMIEKCWEIVDPNIVKSKMVVRNIMELLV